MRQYEELVALLEIENQEWEKEILRRWIEKEGEEKVYEECLKILKNKILELL